MATGLRPADPRDSLHTLAMCADCLCVKCNTCGHRAVLGKAVLPIAQGDMTPIASLKLRCSQCRGADIERLIPMTIDDATAFQRGSRG